MSSKKVLIFQHNPMSYQSANGRTLAVYFSDFFSEDLAQIYVSEMETDYKLCKKFFHLSEKKMFGFRDAERKQSHENSESLRDGKKRLLKELFSSLNLRGYVTIVRDIVWRKKKWDTLELDEWLQEFSPECLFFSCGDIAAEYEMAVDLADRFGIPLVLAVGDDYFTKNRYFPLSQFFYQKRMQKCFRAAYMRANMVVSISAAMKKAVSDKYGDKQYIIAMNAVEENKCYSEYLHKEPFRISYFGNLGINRVDTMISLCEGLRQLNYAGVKYVLDIYTRTQLTKRQLKKLGKYEFCFLHEAVANKDVDGVIEQSSIVLHVESFKRKWRTILETAMSTKTPELLMSGRPIIVIGPKYSSTIIFFEETRTAIVINCTNPKLIANEIEIGIQNREECLKRVQNAKNIAIEYFSAGKTGERLREAITELVDDYTGAGL